MKNIALIGAAIGIALFVGWGTSAEKRNVEFDATHKYNLTSLVAPVEPLQAQFEGTRASVTVMSTGGKAPHLEYQWALLETKEWLFMSERAMQQTCPALSGFAKANAPKIEMAPERMDVLSLAMKGKVATVMAHVPRFKSKPAALEQCIGYTFDSEAGLLRLGGKGVALLAGDLPQWTH